MLQTLADKPGFEAAKVAVSEGKRPSNMSQKEKVEELKTKRRRIREREDLYEEKMEEENNQIANTLATITKVAEAVLLSQTQPDQDTRTKGIHFCHL